MGPSGGSGGQSGLVAGGGAAPRRQRLLRPRRVAVRAATSCGPSRWPSSGTCPAGTWCTSSATSARTRCRWARRGARVVGLDFSSNSLEVARAAGGRVRGDVEFVLCRRPRRPCGPGAPPIRRRLHGVGALNWLPDLDAWARVVHELLRPGGVLYLSEIHPLVLGLSEDGRTLVHDILAAAYKERHRAGGHLRRSRRRTVQPDHLRARPRHERGADRRPRQRADRRARPRALVHERAVAVDRAGGRRMFRLPPGWPRYPLAYSVRARKAG